MECGDYEGVWSSMARGPCAVGLQLNFARSREVPLAVSSRLPRKPALPVVLDPPSVARDATHALPPDIPFMSDMDEISYWIHTKRAPCLMNYDNLGKTETEQAQCSKTENEEVPAPQKRKKKRKLSMLEDESLSTVKQQNVYFEVFPRHNRPLMDICKSDSLGSDIEFNIKNTTIKDKSKRSRMQKKNRPIIHKKAKPLVTSTPKTNVHLRRSQRQVQQSNNNAHINTSFEIYTPSVSNGHEKNNDISNENPKEGLNKSAQLLHTPQINQTVDNKKNACQRSKSKAHVNGQFEDLSDVSGFTANYIRSTKVQSSKTPRKIRCKSSRNLVRDSSQPSRDNNMIVCLNKSINTGMSKIDAVNCSTDSSQNIINLVTSKKNDKSVKVDKSTSLLKFVDTKKKSSKERRSGKVAMKQKNKTDLNVTFQSQSSGTSRYPKRCRNHTTGNTDKTEDNMITSNKNGIEYNNSDKKENPEDPIVPRTRSRRNISLSAQHRENSVLVISNSTEQVSSMVSMNVASPPLAKPKKKRRSSRQVRDKKSVHQIGQSLRGNSLRDKSGFAACFSESDEDSVPLVQRKFFCN